MFTADQLVAHAVGDYVLQSDWMANEKTKYSVAAAAHAFVYALPFLFLARSWQALAFIAVTHYFIDRYRLARYVVYAKNFLAPPKFGLKSMGNDFENSALHFPVRYWHPWEECKGTGYHKDRPAWLAVWLLIIADNVMHVSINAAAIWCFG